MCDSAAHLLQLLVHANCEAILVVAMMPWYASTVSRLNIILHVQCEVRVGTSPLEIP